MRLQTAVDVLGNSHEEDVAQHSGNCTTGGVRLDAGAQFVERARNRLSKSH